MASALENIVDKLQSYHRIMLNIFLKIKISAKGREIRFTWEFRLIYLGGGGIYAKSIFHECRGKGKWKVEHVLYIQITLASGSQLQPTGAIEIQTKIKMLSWPRTQIRNGCVSNQRHQITRGKWEANRTNENRWLKKAQRQQRGNNNNNQDY